MIKLKVPKHWPYLKQEAQENESFGCDGSNLPAKKRPPERPRQHPGDIRFTGNIGFSAKGFEKVADKAVYCYGRL
jgi:hypothetical protein